jgi:exonuclease SbcC
VKELDEQRRTLQQETGGLERRLATVQSTVRDLAHLGREIANKEQKAESVKRALASIPTGYDRQRHEELREETIRLAPLNERATRLSTQIEREDAARAERQRTLTEFESRRSRLAELTTQLTTIAFSEVDFQSLRTKYEEAAAAARSAEVTAAGARSDLSAARMAVEHAESNRKSLERAQQQAHSLQRDKKLHDELDRAYSDLRTDLNFQLRPELSELASAFLAELTDARYSELELDDQYNIVVLEDGVPKPVISGGEEDLAHLVLRLAISQMIAERAGQAFSLLVLDEVFGSLDEARRHNVVDLLRRLQDRFEQVILITHIESVREGLDRVVSIEYDPETGASRVRQGDGQPLTLERVESFGALFEGAGAVDG